MIITGQPELFGALGTRTVNFKPRYWPMILAAYRPSAILYTNRLWFRTQPKLPKSPMIACPLQTSGLARQLRHA